MSDTATAPPAPKADSNRLNQPSFLTAMLCVLIGILCLAFPFVGMMVDPTIVPAKVSYLSIAMAFGLFLTAVGGYTSGKWQGWTFRGAAATVVALFLLMNWSPDSSAKPEIALDVKISNPDLFDHIQSVEVTDEGNSRLYVAPDRLKNHVKVLVEKRNLHDGCIAFSFVPRPEPGNTDGDPEPFNMLVPISFFTIEMEKAKPSPNGRKTFPMVFDASTNTLYDRPLSSEGNDEPKPLNGPDICEEFTEFVEIKPSQRNGFLGGFMRAYAGKKQPDGLIRLLADRDAFTRRSARDQIAAYGPNILPELMEAIPNEQASTHYRLALGAVVSIANMAKQHPVSAMNARLTAQDYLTITELMGHDDQTMRKWATAAMVRLKSERSVDVLLASLDNPNQSANGKYNAGFALTEITKSLPSSVQRSVADRTRQIAPALSVKTRSLVERIPNVLPTEAATAKAEQGIGWVFLGVKYGSKWGEKNFEWPEDGGLPADGDVISATSNVNLRERHIQFDAKTGWQKSPILGLVKSGEKLTVMQVEEVAEGYFWAAVR